MRVRNQRPKVQFPIMCTHTVQCTVLAVHYALRTCTVVVPPATTDGDQSLQTSKFEPDRVDWVMLYHACSTCIVKRKLSDRKIIRPL